MAAKVPGVAAEVEVALAAAGSVNAHPHAHVPWREGSVISSRAANAEAACAHSALSDSFLIVHVSCCAVLQAA